MHAARQWRDGGYIAALLDYGDYVVSYETGVDDQLRFDAHLEVYGDAASLRVQYDTPYVRHLPTTLVVEETDGRRLHPERPPARTSRTPTPTSWSTSTPWSPRAATPKTSPEDFVEDLDLFAELIRAPRQAALSTSRPSSTRTGVCTITSMLTDDDVARFRADGYLLPGRQLFSPEKLDALEAIFNEHLADKGDKLSDELDTPALPRPAAAGLPAQRRGAGHGRAAGRAGHRPVDQPLHLQGPVGRPGHAVARGLGVLERPVRHLRPDRHGLAGAGGPSNRENGCMRVIPGSHLQGGFHDNYVPTDMTVQTFHAEIPDVDESQAVDFELAARRVLAARRPDRARGQAQHQRHPPHRLHHALLPGVGEDDAGGAERGLEDLAGPRRGPRRATRTRT